MKIKLLLLSLLSVLPTFATPTAVTKDTVTNIVANGPVVIGGGNTLTINSGGTFNLAPGAIFAFPSGIPWANVSKSGSNLTDIATRLFADLQSKPTTAAGYGITGGSNLDGIGAHNAAFYLNASNLSGGTVPDAVFPATLPAISGVNLTGLSASQLTIGTVDTARLYTSAVGYNITNGANMDDVATHNAAYYLSASNLAAGTLPDARFPAALPAISGTALTGLSAAQFTTGTLPAARLPAFTGDATSTSGTAALTVGKINGVSLAGLSTGLLKNTTATGAPSIAVSGTDYAPATTGTSILKASSGGFANAIAGTDYQTPLSFTTGLTNTSGTITVNAIQNITGISNLSTNGVAVTTSGNGTLATVAPSTSGNVLTSNGTSWISSTPSVGGNVSNTGTPTSGQIAVWTAATVIQGVTQTSLSDSILGLSGNGFVKRTGANTYTNDTNTYLTANQTITLSGDTTGSGTTAITTTTSKINGVSLSGLATGILKNTTATGAPSIAVAGDFPTLNQNTTGSAATLTTARTIGMTGDVTWTSASFNGGANVTGTSTLNNIPTGTTMAGSLLASVISAPGTPAASKASIYVDSTSKNLAAKNDAGTVNHGVQTRTASSSQWIRAIADDGSTTISQPAAADVSGLAPSATTDTTNASNITSGTLADGRIASALTGKSYNGLSLTANSVGGSIAGGTTFKTFAWLNNLTLSGTDGSTLNVGGGGTLGTAAFVNTSSLVTSLAGTANEITASASTGAATLSLPASLTFTGKTVTGGTFTGGTASGTNVVSTGSSSSRTLAARFGEVVNIRDFGATGNGSTDDKTAINSAIAALTNYSTLYIPTGKYRITGSLNALSSLNHVNIVGDGFGSEIYTDSGASGSNTMVVNTSCSSIVIRDVAFTGSATTRNGAAVCLRLYASGSTVTNCFFGQVANFAIHISNDSGSGWSDSFIVTNNQINGPLGDGIHVGAVTDAIIANNTIRNTGDDAIGVVADDINHVPNRVTVANNDIYGAGSQTGAVSGCGIRIAEATDVLVTGNKVHTTYESGIRVTRYTSTTAYNNRVTISNNDLTNCGGHSGSNTMDISWAYLARVDGNAINDGVFGVGIMLLDLIDSTIQNNIFRNIPSGGIRTDTTTSHVSTNWGVLTVKNNTFVYILANDAIYLVPGSGITLNDMILDGNVGYTILSGSFIYYNQVSTGRVVNNTRLASATITAGGSVSGVTSANNN